MIGDPPALWFPTRATIPPSAIRESYSHGGREIVDRRTVSPAVGPRRLRLEPGTARTRHAYIETNANAIRISVYRRFINTLAATVGVSWGTPRCRRSPAPRRTRSGSAPPRRSPRGLLGSPTAPAIRP